MRQEILKWTREFRQPYRVIKVQALVLHAVLGDRLDDQILVIDLIGSPVSKPLMQALLIVPLKILVQSVSQIRSSFDCVEIDVLVLYAPPKPFNEDVVVAASASIHADFHSCFFEHFRKIRTSELAALVRIEDLWCSVFCQCFI